MTEYQPLRKTEGRDTVLPARVVYPMEIINPIGDYENSNFSQPNISYDRDSGDLHENARVESHLTSSRLTAAQHEGERIVNEELKATVHAEHIGRLNSQRVEEKIKYGIYYDDAMQSRTSIKEAPSAPPLVQKTHLPSDPLKEQFGKPYAIGDYKSIYDSMSAKSPDSSGYVIPDYKSVYESR